MNYSDFTQSERRFRVWMLISSYMYAVSGLFFLVAGFRIAPFVNDISSRVFPSLSPYPLPAEYAEGSFWLVLSLSMMAMITWICRAAYLDLRKNGRLIQVLLLSKFCSTAFYLYFFLSTHQLAHLVGCLTDGPLFIVTLILWIPASTANRFLSEDEEEIMVSVGEAVFPWGGAFEQGYANFRSDCILDARRMLAGQDTMARSAFRILLRIMDITPMVFSRRKITFRRLPLEERIAVLERIESCPVSIPRNILMAIKIIIILPFFNHRETSAIAGYESAEVWE